MQALVMSNRAAVDPISALGLDRADRSDRRANPAGLLLAAQGVVRSRLPSSSRRRAAAPDQIGTARSGVRRFTGNPVSLDFQGADLRAVLRTFSEISSLNIVIDPAVTGSVDVALKDVPWDQALDIILRANKLGYIVDGTIVRIAPLSVLADEETQRRKLTDEQALAGEIRVLTKMLSYAKAEELRPLLLKSALSSRGSVEVDGRTNTLIITDLADRLTTASDLINTLDKAQPQVEIEARIVQVNKNFQRSLGVQWGFNALATPALGNTTGLAFPNSAALTGAQGGTINGIPTAVNLPASAPNSGIGLQLGSVNGAFNLDVALTALETSGNGRVLSTPRVSTQNNVEAEIKQGTQIPIQTVANNTVTVSFKDAALVLKVTPQITAANTVIMKISLENGQADFSKAVNGIPPINTQSANTSVLVNDGQTTVIGGIYLSSEQYQTDRTPGLGRIPLLNWLFKRDNGNRQQHRTADLHHTADYEVTGSTMRRMRIITRTLTAAALLAATSCSSTVRTGERAHVSRRSTAWREFAAARRPASRFIVGFRRHHHGRRRGGTMLGKRVADVRASLFADSGIGDA